MKNTIVLYPTVGRGHLLSMVEVGKLISTHNPSFSIIILILTPPNNQYTTTTAQYITVVSTAVPSVTFHHIPPHHSPPHSHLTTSTSSSAVTANQNVLHVLQSISKTSNLKAIVIDFLNYTATQITTTFNIPTYIYFTSGASALAVFLQFLTLQQNNTSNSLKTLHFCIPGLPLISTSDMPETVLDPASRSYSNFLDVTATMRGGVGIIVNTFEAIEGRAIKALNEGLCLPEGTTPPPLFCIGHVISVQCGEEDNKGCLIWLDSQPSQSMVLLSFGSLGRFSKTRLKEIAIGLERSEQKFLWVVRSDSDEELSLEEFLPKGFLERTKEKGMVVRNWAPQAAILSHDSVGGWVTHCGWNSVLEAICEGVPMVAWPMYAEQKLNIVILVEEMKVALELKECKDGLMCAIELGEQVK